MNRRIWIASFILISCSTSSALADLARGVVFVDANGDGLRDQGESGVADVVVSNGLEVVQTDEDGRYEIDLETGDVLFIVKPRDHQVRVDENRIPRFYYVHHPEGTASDLGLRYAGIAPTGPLPESIDFALTAAPEADQFDVVLFADTQPQSHAELDYVRDDVIADIVGIDAAFGITLGDILYDDLSMFPRYLDIIGEVGVPWWHVPGNHEMNWRAPDDERSLETYQRHLGPTTYSFNVGRVHFVALDDVVYEGTDSGHPRGKGIYHGAFTERQLTWLANDLALVPEDHLVVLTMHIPIATALNPEHPAENVLERDRLFQILAGREHVMAFAGHSHTVEHHYFGREDGFERDEPLHQHVLATGCGSWWSGPRDERGIPVAVQRDGTPNGYTILSIDGIDASARYFAASASPDFQMRIGIDHAHHQLNGTILRDHLPGELWRGPLQASELFGARVFVNVFDAGSRSRVWMSLDGGDWTELDRQFRPDPSTVELEQRNVDTYKSWASTIPSTHLWFGALPATLATGAHTLRVRAVDEYGTEHRDVHVFEVLD